MTTLSPDQTARLADALHNEGDGGIWEHFDRRNAEIVAAGVAPTVAALVAEAVASALHETADDLRQGRIGLDREEQAETLDERATSLRALPVDGHATHLDPINEEKAADALAGIRALFDPMSGRIDNWSER